MSPSRSHPFDSKFVAPLLRWFDLHQRDLPWRRRKSLYRIWVSEIMLQQTQVATVIEYFNRFIKRFPNIGTLASADEAEVLKHWEGLGYYRRARQLHAAARAIVEHHQGKFPHQFDQVIALPGIGRYTAGAILSIALDQRQPILEGNTIRLFSRLIGLTGDPRSANNQRRLWEFAESILPGERVGDFNQALMEVGNRVCTPQKPDCPQCPLMPHCLAFENGQQHRIPAASRKMIYEDVTEAAILITRRSRYLVRLCQPGQRWAGLWDFPRYRIAAPLTVKSVTAATDCLKQQVFDDWGLRIELPSDYWSLKHAVTRYRIRLHVFHAIELGGRIRRSRKLKGTEGDSTDPRILPEVTAKESLAAGAEYRWLNQAELERLPMSVTGRKICQRLG